MSEVIKHSITQSNDGIMLNASNNDEIVSIACNATEKTLEMCTKEVSITLDSGKKKIALETPKFNITLDESGSKVTISDGERSICLGSSNLTLKNGGSQMTISSSEINIQADKIILNGKDIEIG